jgi:hypothetical protein
VAQYHRQRRREPLHLAPSQMEVAVAHAGAGDFHIIAAGLRNINIFL